ncbi:MAG: ketoacyl-ACP synthase III [Anaerolineaceae bacterium]|nr:ketoacyl-ACP synthase III [Anaerolineaceae bacterium]MCB9099093.1 ketoacyl-ACP synthase III [Anaerolineales bacterium]
MATYAHIVGWGKYIPEKIVTNHDLAKILDTSDDWIESRTGISERRHADREKNETTASMAIGAARLALDRARIVPTSVDMVIVATLSPEHIFPSTASLVQDAIGATHAGAFDLSAACSGFIYAFAMGSAMIESGAAKVVVVIGAETVSSFLDDQDRSIYPLFGDGAGAVVLQAHNVPGGVLATVLGSDGSGAEHLGIPAGGSKHPTSQHTLDNRLHYMKMNGREVYRFATRVMGKVSKQACEKAGLDIDQIDLFIPHQANIRIIQSASKYLKIDEDKVFTNLQKYGNTSAASIPIALCEAIEAGRVKTHDKIVMVGFGGGLTWGATVVEWGVPMPHKPRGLWYRSMRWFVYRWAEARSGSLRMSRKIENILPERNGAKDGVLTPDDDVKSEENGHAPASTNGHKPKQKDSDIAKLPPASTGEEVEVPKKVKEK